MYQVRHTQVRRTGHKKVCDLITRKLESSSERRYEAQDESRVPEVRSRRLLLWPLIFRLGFEGRQVISELKDMSVLKHVR